MNMFPLHSGETKMKTWFSKTCYSRIELSPVQPFLKAFLKIAARARHPLCDGGVSLPERFGISLSPWTFPGNSISLYPTSLPAALWFTLGYVGLLWPSYLCLSSSFLPVPYLPVFLCVHFLILSPISLPSPPLPAFLSPSFSPPFFSPLPSCSFPIPLTTPPFL